MSELQLQDRLVWENEVQAAKNWARQISTSYFYLLDNTNYTDPQHALTHTRAHTRIHTHTHTYKYKSVFARFPVQSMVCLNKAAC